MRDLPLQRVEALNPTFNSTVIELLGAITITERCARFWGAIFRCFTTHALHLEVVKRLATHSFINSFKDSSIEEGNQNKYSAIVEKISLEPRMN